MPLDEVHLVSFSLDGFDQAVREFLLAVRSDAFSPALVINDHGAWRLNLELVRQAWSLFEINVLDADLLRRVLILLEPFTESPEALASIEHANVDRFLKSLQHLLCLIGQRELFGRCQVPPLVVP
jgi:hypothetical protein